MAFEIELEACGLEFEINGWRGHTGWPAAPGSRRRRTRAPVTADITLLVD